MRKQFVSLAFLLLLATNITLASNEIIKEEKIIDAKVETVKILRSEYGKELADNVTIETKIDTIQQLSYGATVNKQIKYYCPMGWFFYGNKCVKIIKNEIVSWDSARLSCFNMGGDLLNPPYGNFYFYWLNFIKSYPNYGFNEKITIIGIRKYKENDYFATTRDYQGFLPGSWDACYNTLNNAKFPRLTPTNAANDACGFVTPEPRIFGADCTNSTIASIYVCEKDPKIDYTYDNSKNMYQPVAECYNDLQCGANTYRRCSTDYKCVCVNGYYWSSSEYKCIRCDTGFVFFEGKCYHVSTDSLGWIDAEKACNNKGASLIPIDNDSGLSYFPTKLFGFMNTNYWNLASFWTSGWTDVDAKYKRLDNSVIQPGPWFSIVNIICIDAFNEELELVPSDLKSSCNACLSVSPSTIFNENCDTKKRYICVKTTLSQQLLTDRQSIFAKVSAICKF